MVGTDVDDRTLAVARALCDEDALANVRVLRDDVFASALPEASFDLVHLRFQPAPLGQSMEQLTIARRQAKPQGWIVLEEPDAGGWRENPVAPSTPHLRALIVEAFMRSGGDFNAGRLLPEYLRAVGVDAAIHCVCIALEPGHPYLQLPLQFAGSLRQALLGLVAESEIDLLLEAARAELAELRRWGVTFTLAQAGGRTP